MVVSGVIANFAVVFIAVIDVVIGEAEVDRRGVLIAYAS